MVHVLELREAVIGQSTDFLILKLRYFGLTLLKSDFFFLIFWTLAVNGFVLLLLFFWMMTCEMYAAGDTTCVFVCACILYGEDG